MKLVIVLDMEGITGIVHGDQTTPGHPEYERSRRLMVGDVNAAIRGAFAAGAGEVVVCDGHWNHRNLPIEELDGRTRVHLGLPKPGTMAHGIEAGVHGVFLVGCHARAGAMRAVLDHTWSTLRVAGLWLNGQEMGEIGLHAAACGYAGVPVAMVSGDQAACAEATALLGGVEAAVVKRATGRTSAECLPLEAAALLIEKSAARAVHRLRDGTAPAPFRLTAPVSVEVAFFRTDMADAAEAMPGACRLDGRRIAFRAVDMPEACRAFRALVGLANL
jgi:D-amino peptidase